MRLCIGDTFHYKKQVDLFVFCKYHFELRLMTFAMELNMKTIKLKAESVQYVI